MSLTQLPPDQIASRLYPGRERHQAIASPAALTDDHVRQYWDTGFLAVENVFTPDEVEAAKQGLSHLIGGGNPAFKEIQFEAGVDVSNFNAEARERYVRKLMWFTEYEPRLKALSHHKVLLGIIERLLKSQARMIQDMALLKPPHVGREKPWHQDDAYFMLEPLDMIIGTWTALDPATPENGCMHVIPSSHREGARPHYHDRDCQLADTDVAVDRDVVVPLQPGGVLFFHGLLHHGTPPNQSAARRRAVQYHYASVNCRSTTPEQHGKFFYDAKGMAACTGMQPRAIADKF